MPDFTPDRAEAGTVNVPGICGLEAGIRYVQRLGMPRIFAREAGQAKKAAAALQKLGLPVFAGPHQAGVLSFVTQDCEKTAEALGQMGICLRAGFHCAPLAHQSAGTLDSGTVRVSFGPEAADFQTEALTQGLRRLRNSGRI